MTNQPEPAEPREWRIVGDRITRSSVNGDFGGAEDDFRLDQNLADYLNALEQRLAQAEGERDKSRQEAAEVGKELRVNKDAVTRLNSRIQDILFSGEPRLPDENDLSIAAVRRYRAMKDLDKLTPFEEQPIRLDRERQRAEVAEANHAASLSRISSEVDTAVARWKAENAGLRRALEEVGCQMGVPCERLRVRYDKHGGGPGASRTCPGSGVVPASRKGCAEVSGATAPYSLTL